MPGTVGPGETALHNVVVCTSCSRYPIALLGPSPAWCKSEPYRSRVVREPRAVLREFGYDGAAGVHISVWDSTAELRYFVVPRRPPGTEDFDLEQLAAGVSRDALIGATAAATSGSDATDMTRREIPTSHC